MYRAGPKSSSRWNTKPSTQPNYHHPHSAAAAAGQALWPRVSRRVTTSVCLVELGRGAGAHHQRQHGPWPQNPPHAHTQHAKIYAVDPRHADQPTTPSLARHINTCLQNVQPRAFPTKGLGTRLRDPALISLQEHGLSSIKSGPFRAAMAHRVFRPPPFFPSSPFFFQSTK